MPDSEEDEAAASEYDPAARISYIPQRGDKDSGN
jgi:hypothetical protein